MNKQSLDQRLAGLKASGLPPAEEIESAGERVWQEISSNAVPQPLPDAMPVRFKKPLPIVMLAAAAAVALAVSSVMILQNGVRTTAAVVEGSVSRVVAGKEERLQ